MALARLLTCGVQVQALLTTVTSEYDRVSIHGVRRTLLARQAACLCLPLVEVVLPPSPTNEVYEELFGRTVSELREQIDGVAFGDLFLEEIRAYRERQMATLGMTPVFPLWGEETGPLARRCIEEGYEATVCVVDTTQLSGDFAGARYDAAMLARLPAGVDPCGERGEFHTLVHNTPLFREPIEIETGERVLRDERFMYCDLIDRSEGADDE